MEYAIIKNSILVAVNAEKILKANAQMKSIINRNVGYPDGVGAVWALEKKGVNDTLKIPGCELWLDIIKKFKNDKSFYLVGGKEEVIQRTVQKLKTEFPNINIKGYRNGYIASDQEGQKLIEEISTIKPDIIFVAMGSPKQELLMEEMQKRHPALYQGLGGSFDVYTGNIKRAPDWWIKNNLEWAYRLLKQPTRIKRQVVYLKFYLRLKTNRL
jgi:UDP-N-acetyl-D-mannosaminouronate:lipid I N-acetyl-D-mannosaminouronosyltransferase